MLTNNGSIIGKTLTISGNATIGTDNTNTITINGITNFSEPATFNSLNIADDKLIITEDGNLTGANLTGHSLTIKDLDNETVITLAEDGLATFTVVPICTGSLDGITGNNLVTKAYVDSKIQSGTDWKDPIYAIAIFTNTEPTLETGNAYFMTATDNYDAGTLILYNGGTTTSTLQTGDRLISATTILGYTKNYIYQLTEQPATFTEIIPSIGFTLSNYNYFNTDKNAFEKTTMVYTDNLEWIAVPPIPHSALTEIGTNTHIQIDNHISNTTTAHFGQDLKTTSGPTFVDLKVTSLNVNSSTAVILNTGEIIGTSLNVGEMGAISGGAISGGAISGSSLDITGHITATGASSSISVTGESGSIVANGPNAYIEGTTITGTTVIGRATDWIPRTVFSARENISNETAYITSNGYIHCKNIFTTEPAVTLIIAELSNTNPTFYDSAGNEISVTGLDNINLEIRFYNLGLSVIMELVEPNIYIPSNAIAGTLICISQVPDACMSTMIASAPFILTDDSGTYSNIISMILPRNGSIDSINEIKFSIKTSPDIGRFYGGFNKYMRRLAEPPALPVWGISNSNVSSSYIIHLP